jgi:hypothetical protein
MISQELSLARKLLAKIHIDRCFECRARFSLLSRTTLEVAEYRRHITDRLGPLPSANRERFIRQFEVARLLTDLTEQQQILNEADLTVESGAVGLTNPGPDGVGLARLADLNSAATRELTSGTVESNRSTALTAADITETISQLRSAAVGFIPGHCK